MTRDYFIKHSNELIPNELFYTSITITGDCKDAKDVLTKCLDLCASDILNSKDVEVPVDKINILIFTLLQTR